VLDNLGISVAAAPQAGCCGALSYHLDAQEAALDQMRRNVDAWWPALEAGAEAIVSTASGCGAALDDYARLLAHDEDYAEKASIVAQHSTDLALLLAAEDLSPPPLVSRAGRIAVHIPCTLQHAQRQPDVLPALLQRAGFVLSDTRDAHLCCGSAGTYSILQRDAARRLRDKKLASLTGDAPDVIVSANIGCQLHLQSGSDIPVRHWIELLDPAFDPAG
jgi:glycolate oxidase iron-sulfur subunit